MKQQLKVTQNKKMYLAKYTGLGISDDCITA